jgi:hypothetical protein
LKSLKNPPRQLGGFFSWVNENSIQAVSQSKPNEIHAVIGQFDIRIADMAVGEIQPKALLGVGNTQAHLI